MTDRYTYDAGPYVLGALPPEDRRAFEEHLATCSQCQAEVREFAGLPGLLSRLPAGELPAVLEGAPEPPAPVSVLPSLMRAAGVQRTVRRRRAFVVGIAAALVTAAGSVVVTESVIDSPAAVVAAPPPVQTPQIFTPTSALPVKAQATLTDVPGGTKITMICQYTGPVDGKQHQYGLRLIPKGGGKAQWLGSWPVWGTETYESQVVAPMSRDKIQSLEVVSPDGTALSHLDVN
ncbi:MAG TPA: zf-HC2 domain-containing protein [Mycobacteriales bacterium]|nr:zf-HC2 domain-containing protein [Mycobacteriales bacterium]